MVIKTAVIPSMNIRTGRPKEQKEGEKWGKEDKGKWTARATGQVSTIVGGGAFDAGIVRSSAQSARHASERMC